MTSTHAVYSTKCSSALLVPSQAAYRTDNTENLFAIILTLIFMLNLMRRVCFRLLGLSQKRKKPKGVSEGIGSAKKVKHNSENLYKNKSKQNQKQKKNEKTKL